jgi:cellulose synthase/poly-beta-1,6-N-acetylglucosamine synthase-like glycosyltransferase
MTSLFHIADILIFSFFAITVTYTLFFSMAGLFARSIPEKATTAYAKIAILIPAYKEDSVIISAARSMLLLDYPKHRYEVFVIADQLTSETLRMLRELKVQVVEVSFEKSTKTKSLNHCLSQMDRSVYDLILISDADNILEKSFLRKVNNAYLHGYKAIQGRRVAKNADSNMAVLDGASEIINNHIFRQGPCNLGLSASLIGSAMAFTTDEVTEALGNIQAVGGFDKVLQLSIIEKGHVIHYLPDAIAFDEKVSSHANFQNQRRRWLSSQYRYLFRFFGKGLTMLLKGNVDYFNIAILHNLFLPRILNLGLLPLLTILSYLLNDWLVIPHYAWLILVVTYVLALALALPARFYSWKVAKAILTLPLGFWSMLLLLFRLKGADKQFIHTTHTQTEVENNLFPVDEPKQ